MPIKNTISWDILTLYDAVMAEIEPDLMRVNLPLLSRKYEGENPKQKKARAKRYAAAYEEWKSRLKKIVALWKKEVMGYRDKLLKKAKFQAQESDENALNDLASTIENL